MRKKWLSLFLALCLLLPAVGCGSSGQDGEMLSSAGPLQQTQVSNSPGAQEEQGPHITSINPLTGRSIAAGEENLRPVAVMLNDLKAAMPQLGVSKADVIYEVPAEGGITRMLAVFQSLKNVGDLGSIRSTRPYYMELALGHDAILVHAGGSPDAYNNLSRWKIDNLDGVNGGSDADAFWRDSSRKKNAGYEHSMLTSGENIEAYLAGSSIRREHQEDFRYPIRFSQDSMDYSGIPADHVSVRFSSYKTGIFDYDSRKDGYLVSQYGAPYVDGNTGEQVEVSNVLILRTRVSLVSGDTAGRLYVDLDGEGNGTYICGGQAVDIRWSKADRNAPLTYALANGTPLTLKEGGSYVCIVSNDSDVTIE